MTTSRKDSKLDAKRPASSYTHKLDKSPHHQSLQMNKYDEELQLVQAMQQSMQTYKLENQKAFDNLKQDMKQLKDSSRIKLNTQATEPVLYNPQNDPQYIDAVKIFRNICSKDALVKKDVDENKYQINRVDYRFTMKYLENNNPFHLKRLVNRLKYEKVTSVASLKQLSVNIYADQFFQELPRQYQSVPGMKEFLRKHSDFRDSSYCLELFVRYVNYLDPHDAKTIFTFCECLEQLEKLGLVNRTHDEKYRPSVERQNILALVHNIESISEIRELLKKFESIHKLKPALTRRNYFEMMVYINRGNDIQRLSDYLDAVLLGLNAPMDKVSKTLLPEIIRAAYGPSPKHDYLLDLLRYVARYDYITHEDNYIKLINNQDYAKYILQELKKTPDVRLSNTEFRSILDGVIRKVQIDLTHNGINSKNSVLHRFFGTGQRDSDQSKSVQNHHLSDIKALEHVFKFI